MTAPWDVVVIGGGPAGSTAANLLAAADRSVLLIEREVFPRFHIGESLLPSELGLFRRLGVTLEGETGHLMKRGAEFYDEARGDYALYPFSDSLDGTAHHAWQVDRARFDHQLLLRAEEVGATVHQGERVDGVDVDDEAVTVRTSAASYRSRYVIDASGLDALFAKRERSMRSIRDFGAASVYRHFEGLAPDIAAELESTGNVRILFIDDGWLWAIPLGGQRLSVGLVTKKKGIRAEWLAHEVSRSALLSRLVRGARPSDEPKVVGAFSFYNTRSYGPRWACVGDAAGFLDPIFSSGVSLAMMGAEHLTESLLPALARGTEGEADLMAEHHRHLLHGYNVFATLIEALYKRRVLPGIFFTRDQDGELRKGLTTVLAGDLWREDNMFQNKLWSSFRRRYELEKL